MNAKNIIINGILAIMVGVILGLRQPHLIQHCYVMLEVFLGLTLIEYARKHW